MSMHAQPAVLSLSASELARRLRARELRSVDVVGAHVRRAQAVNGRLNALVVKRFGEAMAEAERADAELDRGADPALRPLLGVPCTIKESFGFEGMPNAAGLVSRGAYRAPADCVTVARLRQAGAIPLGVTNTSELCMWLESSNRLYGRTSNPYDYRHMVGGSSGGEGAIVGAGASPFGLGSDIGGSIRLPAFFNGVFGHKASSGLVPSTGQYPPCDGDARRMLGTGPLCRRAEDLMPLLRILAGPDGVDDTVVPRTLGDPAEVALTGLRVRVVLQAGFGTVAPELRSAIQRAARALAALGAQVDHGEIPELKQSFLLWSQKLAVASPHSFHALLGQGEGPPLGRELVRWAVRRSPHTLPALGLALLEKVPGMGKPDPARVQADLDRTLAAILRTIEPGGVLLCPTFPRVAPRHGVPLLRPFDSGYTGVFNALELPATQVPAGLSRQGLPLGLQVVGLHGQDHVTIAVAMALEKALGGWIPPWQSGRPHAS
ncbi:MAG: amidase [Deltaproteobacteria bacterium]|nr:amidase [Deltaproteobacteria bacterium]